MTELDHKLVAVLNKSIEPGKIMNAVAHMCIGFGASLGPEPLELVDYTDSDGTKYPNISKMPFIILKSNASKLKKLFLDATSQGFDVSAFTETMTVGTWQDQIEKTKETTLEEMKIFGVVIKGPQEKVNSLTKKFSLWN